jgi:hypothetical protein
MTIEKFCTAALVAILCLAGYGAMRAVSSVAAAFSTPSATIVKVNSGNYR